MRQAGPADLNMFLGPRKGALLVTLAPERVPEGFIAKLVQSGVEFRSAIQWQRMTELLPRWPKGSAAFTPLQCHEADG